MKIKLSIPALQKLSNNDALLLFAVASCLAFNPNADITDIIRVSTFGYDSTYNKLNHFEELGLIEIEHSKTGNRYSYIDPTDKYIIVDTSLFKTDVSRNVVGSLVRLKCWSRINTNIVDLSLNRVVHEVSVSHESIYRAIEEGLIKRGEKNLYFEFIHPSLCTPA